MLNTEAGPRRKTPYHPTEEEERMVELSLRWNFLRNLLPDVGSKVRSNRGRVLGATALGVGTVIGPSIYDAASAYVEAAPQNSTRDDILNKISIPPLPELPQISTPVATPVPNSIGGRGFRIGELAPGTIKSEWQAGTNMSLRYRIIRYSAQGPILLPVPGMIMPEVTTYTDTPPGTPACYLLIAQDGQNIIANSDLVCLLLDSRLGLFPQELNIRLDQSDTARLSWKNPGNITDYQLQVFGSNPGIFPVSGSSTETTLQTGGQPACAVLIPRQNGVNVGLSEVLCAIPRVSKFPNPGLTPTPTVNPNISPTPTIHPYYTQIFFIEGSEGRIYIKAGSMVDSKALQIARDAVLDITSYRSDIRNRLAERNVFVAIIPKDGLITSLPDFSDLAAQYSSTRGFAAGIKSAVAEENLLGLSTDPYTSIGYKAIYHEFPHVVEWNGLTDNEKTAWIPIYDRISKQAGFPNNWGDILYYPPQLIYEAEFFAEVSRVWFKGMSTQIRAKDNGVAAYFESIYGPR